MSKIVSGTIVLTIALSASPLSAVTATKSTVFSGGWFTPNVTYDWVVTPLATTVFNEVVIDFLDITVIAGATYVGPGTITLIPGATPPSGQLVIQSCPTPPACTPRFTGPVSFSISTFSNPKTVEGLQTVNLRLDGTISSPTPTQAFVPRFDDVFQPGETTVTFIPGTFLPASTLDFFQATTIADPLVDAHLGTTVAGADGAASLTLSRALVLGDLFAGENGEISGAFTVSSAVPIPTLSGLALSLCALLIFISGVLLLRRSAYV